MTRNADINADWDFNGLWKDVDFQGVWKDLDFKGMEFPGLDMKAVQAAQQRNLEALSTAGTVAVEGFETIARRETEIVREALERTAEAAQEFTALATPQELVAKQAEFAKGAFEMGLANMREISALWAQTAEKAMGLVSSRVSESLDEIKDIIEDGQERPAPKAAPKAAADK